jgi:hypothetical protein
MNAGLIAKDVMDLRACNDFVSIGAWSFPVN